VEGWIRHLQRGEVIAAMSTVGGGSLPGEEMRTFALGLKMRGLPGFLSALRHARIPVIARIAEDRALFDPRTILPEEENDFLQILSETLNRSEQ